MVYQISSGQGPAECELGVAKFLEYLQKNYKVTVKEFNGSIVFLRKIARGGANRSFGIEVAALAGVPNVICNRAKEIVKRLENSDVTYQIDAVETATSKQKVSAVGNEIISMLKEIVREHIELINDRDTLEELLTIIKNEKGRIEAPVGGHDDQMMGLAIAHFIRSQVVFEPKPEIKKEQIFNFDDEKVYKDYGEELEIV